VLRVDRFDLRHTLECGQFFQFERRNGGYRVHTQGRLFEIRQAGDRLTFEGADGSFVRNFFALDHRAEEVERELGFDRHVRTAMEEFGGIRILRQDPYECALGFITSICSNIPRIRSNVRSIAVAFGRGGGLPGPETVLDERRLRGLGLGFRAPYLVSAQKYAALFAGVGRLNEEEARAELMRIDGVAEKVADCILLYGYGRLGVFPVDTWIRKAMRALYFGGRRASDGEIRALARDRFGRWAGYAQQYLYAWSRLHLKRGVAV
jgi:N-glycosylase/DNA lyase